MKMNEFSVLCLSMLSGIAAGFTYDIFRLKRRILRSGVVTIQIEDAIFWIFTTLIVLITIQRSNDGEIRIYPLLSTVAGCFLYLLITTKCFWKKIKRKTYKNKKSVKKINKKFKNC